MYRLDCAIRDYAWGSRTHLPRFLGRAPDGSPQAELWVGAHPGDPARLPDGRTLDVAIRDRPEPALGRRVVEMFGPRLPFMVKALAAAEPLSLQVHPTSERARLGYADENAAGVPIGDPVRNYQDEFHKPELVLALTRFEGMAGFRDVEKSAQILRLLDSPWAEDVADRLESGPAFQALHGVVADILHLDSGRLDGLVAAVGEAAQRAEQVAHRRRPPGSRRLLERTSVQRESTRVFAQTAALAARYPNDPGVLVTLLLNHVVLAPGEAMFLDAGVVHAYTSGFGIEIMASSDNVVRAGLTPKHVDIVELLQIASFTPMPPPVWEPTRIGDDVWRYAPPVSEFSLVVGTTPLADLPREGPRVVIVLEGEVEVVASSGRELLGRGEAVFVGDDDGPVEIGSGGRVAVGAVPA
jgi:mannose-6-phosphate isomerase